MTRKATIPIYDGDDFERMAELRREVDIAERKAEADRLNRGASRIGDDDPAEPDYVIEARAAFDAFVDEAAERAETWVLEPIGHEEFRALLKEHLPRKVTGEGGKEVDHPDDEPWGVNTETFPRALLTYVDPDDAEIRTVAEPRLDATQLRRRLKRLAAGEFESMWLSALMLNKQGVVDPRAGKFSPSTQRSTGT